MTEWIAGNVFIRPNVAKYNGYFIDGHTHNFDHVSFFKKGCWEVDLTTPNNETNTYSFNSKSPNSHLLIKANNKHKLTQVADKDRIYVLCTLQNELEQFKLKKIENLDLLKKFLDNEKVSYGEFYTIYSHSDFNIINSEVNSCVEGNIVICKEVSNDIGECFKKPVRSFDVVNIFSKGCWKIEAKLPNGNLINRIFNSRVSAKSHALIKEDVEYTLTHIIDEEKIININDVNQAILDVEKGSLEEIKTIENFIEEEKYEAEQLGEFWCVYSHRTPQGKVSVEATGWNEAYV